MQEKAPCPECEIRALQSRITKESIASSVAKMAQLKGVTTEEGEYKRRLAVCERCPSLRSEILCAECGSYVAYRARIASACCPFPGQDKWQTEQSPREPQEKSYRSTKKPEINRLSSATVRQES